VRAPRLVVIVSLILALLAAPLAAEAQQAGKVYRIGFLRVGPPPAAWIEGLRQGLRELGYLEGRNMVIEFGLASSAAQVPDVAAELVRLKVDVIVASGTPSLLPAREAAGKIPVVFVAAIDPVATRLVASLARPGGNVTGMTAMQADITGKRLQLLRELLPNLSRIALMVRATSQANALYVQETESAARALGVQVQILTPRGPGDIEGTITAAQGASALVVADDAVFTTHRARIAALALKSRLPTACGIRNLVEVGGLMAYGPHYADLYRRAATQVHKILTGAKPADLPIEQPTKFELVINLKTAKALGLTIPPSVLARADEVIE
jgi:putative ABC transport system substrate-binding protein